MNPPQTNEIKINDQKIFLYLNYQKQQTKYFLFIIITYF